MAGGFEQRRSDEQGSSRGKPTERRRRKDWVVRLVSIGALLGWCAAIVSLMLVRFAVPRRGTMFHFFEGIFYYGHWDTNLLRIALITLVISFFICVIGFIANIARSRRKSDRFHKGVITMGILSLIGIVVFLVNYSYFL